MIRAAVVPPIVLCFELFVVNNNDIAASLKNFFKNGQLHVLPALKDHKSEFFDKPIQTIASKPIFVVLIPDLPFIIDTDAGDYQFRAALFQSHPYEERKKIWIFILPLNSHKKRFSVTVRECLAVVRGLQLLRIYIQRTFSTEHSNQASEQWIVEAFGPNGRPMR